MPRSSPPASFHAKFVLAAAGSHSSGSFQASATSGCLAAHAPSSNLWPGRHTVLVSIELRLSSNHGSLCCCPASLCALEDSLNDTSPSCRIALLGGVEAPRHVHCRPQVVPLVIFLQLKIILTSTGWVRGLRLRAWLGPVSARDQR